MAQALIYLQKNLGIAHRDIKPQNILYFEDGTYKIGDFGEAKEAKMAMLKNSLRGTELYMSPSLYNGLKNNENDELIHKIENKAEQTVTTALQNPKSTFATLKSDITEALYPFINNLTGRKPIILPVILDIKR